MSQTWILPQETKLQGRNLDYRVVIPSFGSLRRPSNRNNPLVAMDWVDPEDAAPLMVSVLQLEDVTKSFLAMASNPKYGRQVGLLLPPQLVRQLDRHITENEKYVSRSKVVAKAIDQYLANYDPQDSN